MRRERYRVADVELGLGRVVVPGGDGVLVAVDYEFAVGAPCAFAFGSFFEVNLGLRGDDSGDGLDGGLYEQVHDSYYL